MKSVWSIILRFIGSVGGVGAVLCFFANKIADKLGRNYESRLARQLEAYKSELNSKEHIVQLQYEKEFQSYSELLSKACAMVQCSFWLFPTCLDAVPQSEKEKYDLFSDRYRQAQEAHNSFLAMYLERTPFLNDNISDKFEHLRNLCEKQINMFIFCGALALQQAHKDEIKDKRKDDEADKCYLRTEEISKELKDLLNAIKTYLNELKAERT